MDWFSILKNWNPNAYRSQDYQRAKDEESEERVGRKLKSRENFLEILATNAELELPEIEQRAEEAKRQTSELVNTMEDMGVKYNNALVKLTTKRDERKSRLDELNDNWPAGVTYSTQNTKVNSIGRQIANWDNKIKELGKVSRTKKETFKDELSRLENEEKRAEEDLETYRRFNQSGQEFINMAKEYDWDLPNELDSFLRILDVVHGVTPEAIEGIIGLMPQKTEGENTNRWKNGLRRTDIPMQGEEKIMQVVQQLISRGIAPKDITKYTIHDEMGIDHKDLGSKWNVKDDEALKEVIEMRSKSYRPMSEAERKWRGL